MLAPANVEAAAEEEKDHEDDEDDGEHLKLLHGACPVGRDWG